MFTARMAHWQHLTWTKRERERERETETNTECSSFAPSQVHLLSVCPTCQSPKLREDNGTLIFHRHSNHHRDQDHLQCTRGTNAWHGPTSIHETMSDSCHGMCHCFYCGCSFWEGKMLRLLWLLSLVLVLLSVLCCSKQQHARWQNNQLGEQRRGEERKKERWGWGWARERGRGASIR